MPLLNNRRILRDAMTTGNLASGGYLNPEQAERFLMETYEATTLSPLIRHEVRRAKTGEIDKMGIGARLLRRKTENSDDGYRAAVNHGKLEYRCTNVRLPWEITEETLRENIEGQRYEALVSGLMSSQVGRDLEDLCLNGDESVAATDPDYDFLKLDDGWIKQIRNGGHVIDRQSINSGAMSLDCFYDALAAMPNKFNNGKLRWLMSPHRRQAWEKYILSQAVTAGGIITDKRVENPAAIPAIEVPSMPDACILLTDPKNLIQVSTYEVRIRKTTEGKSAIMEDKRFYVIHFDTDAIIEETDATAIIDNLAAVV